VKNSSHRFIDDDLQKKVDQKNFVNKNKFYYTREHFPHQVRESSEKYTIQTKKIIN